MHLVLKLAPPKLALMNSNKKQQHSANGATNTALVLNFKFRPAVIGSRVDEIRKIGSCSRV